MYLLTMSSPDINNVAMSLYNIITVPTLIGKDNEWNHSTQESTRQDLHTVEGPTVIVRHTCTHTHRHMHKRAHMNARIHTRTHTCTHESVLYLEVSSRGVGVWVGGQG